MLGINRLTGDDNPNHPTPRIAWFALVAALVTGLVLDDAEGRCWVPEERLGKT